MMNQRGNRKSKEEKDNEFQVKPILALRQWCSLYPSMRFYVIVYEDQILGISQKDPTSYYPFLKNSKDHLRELIRQFYHDFIQGELPISNCI